MMTVTMVKKLTQVKAFWLLDNNNYHIDQYSMYSAAMTKGVKSKKKSKGKAKKKDSIEQQKTDVVIG